MNKNNIFVNDWIAEHVGSVRYDDETNYKAMIRFYIDLKR